MHPNIFCSEMLSWMIEIWMKAHLISDIICYIVNLWCPKCFFTMNDKYYWARQIELVALNTILSVLCVCLHLTTAPHLLADISIQQIPHVRRGDLISSYRLGSWLVASFDFLCTNFMMYFYIILKNDRRRENLHGSTWISLDNFAQKSPWTLFHMLKTWHKIMIFLCGQIETKEGILIWTVLHRSVSYCVSMDLYVMNPSTSYVIEGIFQTIHYRFTMQSSRSSVKVSHSHHQKIVTMMLCITLFNWVMGLGGIGNMPCKVLDLYLMDAC